MSTLNRAAVDTEHLLESKPKAGAPGETHRPGPAHAPRPRHWGWLRYAIPALLIAAGVGVVIWIASLPQPAQPPPPPELPPVNVSVEVIGPLPELADAFTLTAVVEPERIVRVAAEVSGRIERRGTRTETTGLRGRTFSAGAELDEGQPVVAGEPLVYLNSDLLEARVASAAAQFEFDQSEFERILDLYERQLTSQTDLDQARTRRDVSKAGLDEAQRQLERAVIRAPVSGILNRLPLENGEYVSPGDIVAEIVNVDPVKVVVDVPERDIGYLQVGETAEVILSEAESRTGRISYISELADESTRTTRIEITVGNGDYALRSGQIVRARLTRRVLADVIMIPLAAVIPLENGKAAYVVVDGQAERRDVELGFIKGRRVRVVSGLAAGDRLIVAGHRYVGPGQPVRIVADAEFQP